MLKPESERHPHGDGNAVSQRAGRQLDPRNLEAVGMAPEPGLKRTEGRQLLGAEVAVVRQNGVETERTVTFAEDENVTLRRVRPRRIVLHGFVDRTQHLDDRKRGRYMAMPARVGSAQYGTAYLPACRRHCRHLLDLHERHAGSHRQALDTHVVEAEYLVQGDGFPRENIVA